MIVDASTFVGPYPFRELPWHSADALLAAMDQVGIDAAWVGYLPAILHQDPAPGNETLAKALEAHRDRLSPIPVVQPDLPRWEQDLDRAVDDGAPAIRVYPMHAGIDPASPLVQRLVGTAAERGLATVITIRFEDVRQRHQLDASPDFPAAAVRTLARTGEQTRLLVTHASREFVEEVHFGLTKAEADRVLWDVTWLWGPPTDEIAQLLDTVGADRFAFGTSMPLRLPEATIARLDLSDLDPEVRAGIESGNLHQWRL